MSRCRLIHCIADVLSFLLTSTSPPPVAGHKTNANCLDHSKCAPLIPLNTSSQRWHAPNFKMASETKETSIKEYPNGYSVPGQWPDNGSPYNIVDSPAPSPLLRLPPELRNTIYKFALRLDKGLCRVSKTAGTPEPALLLTCKEIRREAVSIFYSVNEVIMMVESYSQSVPRFMMEKYSALKTQYHYELNIGKVEQLGPRSWRNLLSWLRDSHENASTPMGFLSLASELGTPQHKRGTGHHEKEAAVVDGMFLLTRTMKDMSWDEVEPILNLLRYGLERLSSE